MLEKIFELIDQMQKEIGNGCHVQFSVHEKSLRYQVSWVNHEVRYRYQFPIEEISRLKAEHGSEEFLISYLIGLSKKEFSKSKETHK